MPKEFYYPDRLHQENKNLTNKHSLASLHSKVLENIFKEYADKGIISEPQYIGRLPIQVDFSVNQCIVWNQSTAAVNKEVALATNSLILLAMLTL